MQTFPDCIAHVLAAEGGLVNNPQDPGGVTKFGISQRSYPALDIRALSLDDAKTIYQRDYWDKIQGERLPAGLDPVVLDHAVNVGPARANTLRQGLITTPVASIMAPVTNGRHPWPRRPDPHRRTTGVEQQHCPVAPRYHPGGPVQVARGSVSRSREKSPRS